MPGLQSQEQTSIELFANNMSSSFDLSLLKSSKGNSLIELYFKRGLEIGCLGIEVEDFQKAPIKIWTKLAWKKNDDDQNFKFLSVV